MVNDWTRRHRLLIPLIQAGLVLLFWAAPGYAALLRDIRIGEYEGFTRIVFEFNEHTDAESIKNEQTGTLTCTFPNVQPKLARKIPLDQNNTLLNIQIRQQQLKLVAIFSFNFKKLRYDSFQLKSPPRLVIDVYQAKAVPTAAEAGAPDASPFTPESGPTTSLTQDESAPPIRPGSTPMQSPLPLDRLSYRHGETANSTDPIVDQPIDTLPTPTQSRNAPGSQPRLGAEGGEAAPAQQSDPTQPGPFPADPSPTSGKGLQYYLLVALVVLTITILVLLILMLFSRHKWTRKKKPLKLDELLHRQDEHIAALNSQIEEHLKRYNDI